MSHQSPSKFHSLLMSVYNTCTFRHSQYTVQTVGGPFLEMMKESPYAGVLEDPNQSYEMYLDKNNLHWFLLLRVSTLPYITFEISTLNMIDLLTVTRVINDNETESKKLTYIGKYSGKLSVFCTTADRVCVAMGRYKLLQNNCQHFCNNLAYQFELKIHSPTGYTLCSVPVITVKKPLKDEQELELPQEMEIAPVMYRSSFQRTPQVVQKNVARAVAVITGVKGYNDIMSQAASKNEQLA